MLDRPNGITAQYGLNQDSRLQSLNYTRGSTSIGTLSYLYDPLGNRIEVDGTLARTNLPIAVSSASYDAANQLNVWSGVSASYDANGNTLTDVTGNQFTWNSRNQLTGITNSSTAFLYDAYGRRAAKGNGGQTTSYLYDGLNRVLESAAGVNTTLLPGGIDEYFLRNNGSTSVPIVDGLGSVLETTDANANTLASYWYAPYGWTSVNGSDSNTTEFSGRENDGGLYYYRARYLNPVTGRFLSQDPLGMVAGPNQYAYSGANPVSFRDPLGLDKEPPDADEPICPPVPPHPADVSVDGNIAYTEAISDFTVPGALGPSIPVGKIVAPFVWFRDVCCWSSPWNYNAIGREYDDFGTFDYGATGVALGIPNNVLLGAAGIAKNLNYWSKGQSNPYLDQPLWNDPQKMDMIVQGINYAHLSCRE